MEPIVSVRFIEMLWDSISSKTNVYDASAAVFTAVWEVNYGTAAGYYVRKMRALGTIH